MKWLAYPLGLLLAASAQAQEAEFIGEWIVNCTSNVADLYDQIPDGDPRTVAREATKMALGHDAVCARTPLWLCEYASDQTSCLKDATNTYLSLSADLLSKLPETIEGEPLEVQMYEENIARGLDVPIPGSFYAECLGGELESFDGFPMIPAECEYRRAAMGHDKLRYLNRWYGND